MNCCDRCITKMVSIINSGKNEAFFMCFFCKIQLEMAWKKEDGTESKDMKRNCDEQKQQTPCGCSSSTSNSPWLTSGEGWWLASNPSLDMSNQG